MSKDILISDITVTNPVGSYFNSDELSLGWYKLPKLYVTDEAYLLLGNDIYTLLNVLGYSYVMGNSETDSIGSFMTHVLSESTTNILSANLPIDKLTILLNNDMIIDVLSKEKSTLVNDVYRFDKMFLHNTMITYSCKKIMLYVE